MNKHRLQKTKAENQQKIIEYFEKRRLEEKSNKKKKTKFCDVFFYFLEKCEL